MWLYREVLSFLFAVFESLVRSFPLSRWEYKGVSVMLNLFQYRMLH